MSQGLWFSLDPERAHRVALNLLRVGGATAPGRAAIRARYGVASPDPSQATTLWGLPFRNRLGLAAGWDKDGLGLRGLANLPFGHIEIGTVTPRPQDGNPRPRIFRLKEDRALINRMGFPGKGADFVHQQLTAFMRQASDPERHPIVGVNIGKNKDTPNERAIDDYRSLMLRFAEIADYLVINISSPNTVGLRDLQARAALEGMLAALADARQTLTPDAARTPLLLKLSPDLTPAELRDAVDTALGHGIDGLVVSNTTLSREGLTSPHAAEAGGLSGAPLTQRADAVLDAVARQIQGRVPIIAAGGVMNVADYRRKLELGASLVQVYSGLVYGGPGWPKSLLREAGMAP